MSHQFYVERNNKRSGPFSATQLKTLGAANRIRSTDIVWQDDRDKGVLAAQVTGLRSVVHADTFSEVAVPVDETSCSPSVEDVAPPIIVEICRPPHTEHVQETLSRPIAVEIPDGLRLKRIPGEIDIDDIPPVATEPATYLDQPTRQKDRASKLRAVAVKGAVILRQHGSVVTYKKICFKCNHEDDSAARMPLRSGLSRATFFCPTCRKMREVEIQASR